MNRDRKEEGFTLIEVLVALAILSISMAVLLGVFSDSLSRVRANETRTVAGALAQSLLAEVGISRPLHVGDETGDLANGYRWRLHAEPYGSDQDRQAWPVVALLVSVAVWKEGDAAKAMELTTLRLLPKGPQE